MDWPSPEASLQYLLRVTFALALALALDRALSRYVRFRVWLWGLTFLFPLLLLLPRPEVRIPLIDRVVPTATLDTRVYELEPAFLTSPMERLGYPGPSPVVAALLLLSAGGVVWWVLQVIQAWRLVRTSEQVTDPEIVSIVAEVAELKGMSNPPFVVLTDRVHSPCTVGVIQPYVIVPARWTTDLDLAAWRAMLAHEVGHIVHADSLRVALYALAQAVFWWHPLSWWALQRSVVAMEQANDAELLGEGHADPKAYATLLIASATGFSLQTVLRFVGKGALLTRVESILEPRERSLSAWPAASLVLFALAAPHYDFVQTPVPDPSHIRPGETAYAGEEGGWIASTNGVHRVRAVNYGPKMGLRAVSPDGRKVVLAYTPAPGEEDLYIANTDGTGLRPLVATKGRDFSPRFSPDGKLVTFGTRVTGLWEVGVVDVETGKWRLVTKDGKSNLEPSFHPNGKRIVFSSHRTVDQKLWSINLDGTGLVRLTFDSAEDTGGSYSRDGRYLLYTTHCHGKYEPVILDLATNKVRFVARSSDVESGEARWVDGDTAVVFSVRVDDRVEIHRVDRDGRNRRVIDRFSYYPMPPD